MSRNKPSGPAGAEAAGLIYSGALTTIEVFPLDKDGRRLADKDGKFLPATRELTLVPGRPYGDELPRDHPLVAHMIAKGHFAPAPPPAGSKALAAALVAVPEQKG